MGQNVYLAAAELDEAVRRMGADTPNLTVIIPAYDEAGRLPSTLRGMQAFLATRTWRVEVVVIDDGSRDPTASSTTARPTRGHTMADGFIFGLTGTTASMSSARRCNTPLDRKGV